MFLNRNRLINLCIGQNKPILEVTWKDFNNLEDFTFEHSFRFIKDSIQTYNFDYILLTVNPDHDFVYENQLKRIISKLAVTIYGTSVVKIACVLPETVNPAVAINKKEINTPLQQAGFLNKIFSNHNEATEWLINS